MRGNRKDFDGWAAKGLAGWSYDEILPYFKKSEANQEELFQKSGKFMLHIYLKRSI